MCTLEEFEQDCTWEPQNHCNRWIESKYNLNHGCPRIMGAPESWVPQNHGCSRIMGAPESWVSQNHGCPRIMGAPESWVPQNSVCAFHRVIDWYHEQQPGLRSPWQPRTSCATQPRKSGINWQPRHVRQCSWHRISSSVCWNFLFFHSDCLLFLLQIILIIM